MISREPEQLFGDDTADQAAPGDSRTTFDDRRNHLLSAATGVIARLGYEKASMRCVAKAADSSLAGLYHYFDSKEKMLFLIQFRAFSALLTSLQEKLNGVDDPIEQLQVMVRNQVGYFAANMAALKVCSHEMDSLTGPAFEETRRIRREYFALTRSILDRILSAQAPESTIDRRVATMSLFGTLNWLYRWYDPKRGPAPSSVAAQIASQFLGGVLGTASSKEEKV